MKVKDNPVLARKKGSEGKSGFSYEENIKDTMLSKKREFLYQHIDYDEKTNGE